VQGGAESLRGLRGDSYAPVSNGRGFHFVTSRFRSSRPEDPAFAGFPLLRFHWLQPAHLNEALDNSVKPMEVHQGVIPVYYCDATDFRVPFGSADAIDYFKIRFQEKETLQLPDSSINRGTHHGDSPHFRLCRY
jgi:hypothetical protein